MLRTECPECKTVLTAPSLAELAAALAATRAAAPPSQELDDMMLRLGELSDQNRALLAEAALVAESDPKALEELQVLARTGLDAANRWIGARPACAAARRLRLTRARPLADNTFLLKQWCDKKLGDPASTKSFFKQCGIDDIDELDYIDEKMAVC